MKLSDVQGQNPVAERLQRAWRSGRLAHGYLFTGDEGTGRENLAQALAQLVLCEQPGDAEACGVCGSCLRVQAGSHPDLQVVTSEAEAVRRGLAKPEGSRNPSTEIRIEAVRELSRRLRMHSYEGQGRVGIVVSAHRLRVEAANALLKTLEEPAPGTLLVLIAPGPRALLDTLRSRCQIVRFAPLSPEVIAALLAQRSGESVEVWQQAAERAEGSVRRAEALRGEELEERRELCRAYLDAVRSSRQVEMLDLAADMSRDRQATAGLLDELARLLHEEVCSAGRAGERRRTEAWGHAFDLVRDAERALRGNAVAQLTLEALAVRLHPLLNATAADPGSVRRDG